MMWKDSYRLGVERIDRQHMELFRMTEELIHAIDSPAAADASRQAPLLPPAQVGSIPQQAAGKAAPMHWEAPLPAAFHYEIVTPIASS